MSSHEVAEMTAQPLHDPRTAPRRGDALYIDGRCWRCCAARGDRVVIAPPLASSTLTVTRADWAEIAAAAEAVTVSLREEG